MTYYNKNRHKVFIFLMSAWVILFNNACSKDWLEKKPSKSEVVPTKLPELQALLDNETIMNKEATFWGELSTDDYYVSDVTWQTQTSLYVKNSYIWAKDVDEGIEPAITNSWSAPYRIVFYSNVALEGLKDITPASNAVQDQWNQVKGSALFYRAFAYNLLVQNFAPVYTQETAGNALGIPLRNTSSIEEPIKRSTLKESYEAIIKDLQEASQLLPNLTNTARTRPSKAAAFALLSKVYLSMSDYSRSLQFADSCLAYNNTLFDYNKITSTATFPIVRFNPEMLFYFTMTSVNFTSYPQRKVDTVLYGTYQVNDLRLKYFFSKQTDGIRYIGSYDGTANFFFGLANDEVYLNKAECHARLGSLENALGSLNELLKNRFRTGFFTPAIAPDPEKALELILAERRKELIFRGCRWTDLRRLNQDPKFARNLKRIIAGVTYSLPAKDSRYVFAIPKKVVEFNGIQQNVR